MTSSDSLAPWLMLNPFDKVRDRKATESSEEPKPGPDSYTIDDLARLSQVPSRTIRYYQSKGVLPKPNIVGRVAYYGKPHVERLELIASLQDRGLRIEAIREVVSRIDKGELDVGEWLGLTEQLHEPWANDEPRTMTEDEVYQLAGRKRSGLLNDLVRGKFIERRENVFFVPSPALLSIAGRLESTGVDVDGAVRARAILDRYMGKVAKELTELFVGRDKIASIDDPKIFEELRPLAMDAMRILFAQAMQSELRNLATSGRTAKSSRRRR